MSVKANKKDVLKNVSIALYQVRKYIANVDQPFAAAETGITQQQLSAYEKGETLPSLLSIIALADLYGVSLDYLVGRCGNREAHKTQRMMKYKED